MKTKFYLLFFCIFSATTSYAVYFACGQGQENPLAKLAHATEKVNYKSVVADKTPVAEGDTMLVYDLGDGRIAKVLKGADSQQEWQAADLESNVKHAAGIKLEWEGHPIAPKIDQILYNDKGIAVGFIEEKVPGTELATLIKERKISKAEAHEIYDEVIRQVVFLNSHNINHGDVHQRNVLVERKPEGGFSVRLVDFTRLVLWYPGDKRSAERKILPYINEMPDD